MEWTRSDEISVLACCISILSAVASVTQAFYARRIFNTARDADQPQVELFALPVPQWKGWSQVYIIARNVGASNIYLTSIRSVYPHIPFFRIGDFLESGSDGWIFPPEPHLGQGVLKIDLEYQQILPKGQISGDFEDNAVVALLVEAKRNGPHKIRVAYDVVFAFANRSHADVVVEVSGYLP